MERGFYTLQIPFRTLAGIFPYKDLNKYRLTNSLQFLLTVPHPNSPIKVTALTLPLPDRAIQAVFSVLK